MRLAGLKRFVSNVLAMAYREGAVMRHDAAFMAVVTVQPLVMLLLFGGALSNEPDNVPWAVLDQSRSEVSRRLVSDVRSTGYFLEPRAVASQAEGADLLRTGKALAFLVIPRDFRRDALRGGPEVQLLLDGADPLNAARVGGILRSVAARFDPNARGSLRAQPPPHAGALDVRGRFWFNSTLSDRDFFLATLAGMLLTNLCLSLSSLGLVSERENGTYEQTLSLPTSPLEIVLGKLLPYVGVSYGVLAFAVIGAGVIFGVWPAGSWIAMLILTLPFVLASLAIGVFVSSLAKSSAQAVFITVFFILPSFVLSGAMFPYQLMPDGVRQVGAVLPLRWYQIGLRGVISRGGGLDDIWLPVLALCAIFAGLLLLIRWRLKPRLG
jgi:ABC-2 type transport system permease protein